MKVRGQNSNSNTVKHMSEIKMQNKVSGDKDAAGFTSLVPGVKSLRPQNSPEPNRAY